MEWFDTWFNSKYYHILYKHHDGDQAQFFIQNLVQKLAFQRQDKIMDLACGKGRHAIFLNQLGYDVVGLDLSAENISYAQQFNNERLKFYIHDMRQVFKASTFGCVLNLFTSFGYFETQSENQKAIQAMAKNLKTNGILILDFFNTKTILKNLMPYEEKIIDGIHFKITKTLQDNLIIKDIVFQDDNQQFHFQEKVYAIYQEEFLEYFHTAGLELLEILGDYSLQPIYENSPRMIFILKKL